MKYKTNLAIPTAIVLAVLAVSMIVRAKSGSSPNDSDKLNQGIALFKQGKLAEARAAFTNLLVGSAVRPQAKSYDALCRYEQGDRKGFLNAMESAEIKSAPLPDDVREDLDYKQIDSLMYFRKFEELLPKIEEFALQHGASPRTEAMAEYQLAVLYERGMKKMTESAQLRTRGDGAGAEYRLREGEDNLGQFLKLAVDGRRDSYQTLKGRDLPVEVLKTMAALGGEDDAIKTVSPAKREDAALALVQLHKKIDADADANLRRMTNFLNDFPGSKYLKRVQLDMAYVALDEGWRLTWAYRRTNAAPYLNKARALLSSVVADPQAGISEADVQESRIEMLLILYSQNDWAGLSTHTAQLLTNTPPGGRDWLAIKLYKASGLARQKKLAQAASELDEMLATGFKGIPTYDGLLVPAAEWRIRVAQQAGDEATVQRVAQLVQDSVCYGSLKRTFAENFKKMAAQSKPLSK